MECLKLIARPSFAEKRIGYLGLMSLLDEKQEVLMLVTNSIQQDLKGKNQYSIGLALCALGNLCSAEMARDLVVDVKRIMRSSTIYLKKKAAICAVRLSQKAPELVRDFMDEAHSDHDFVFFLVPLQIWGRPGSYGDGVSSLPSSLSRNRNRGLVPRE